MIMKMKRKTIFLFFRFTFKDVTGKGKVGLFIRGDSLVPENYDISYVDSESSLMVRM